MNPGDTQAAATLRFMVWHLLGRRGRRRSEISANLLTATSRRPLSLMRPTSSRGLTRQTDSNAREAPRQAGRRPHSHAERCHSKEFNERAAEACRRLSMLLIARSTECSVSGRPGSSLSSQRGVLASTLDSSFRLCVIESLRSEFGNASLRKLNEGRRRNSGMIYFPLLLPIFIRFFLSLNPVRLKKICRRIKN